MAKKTEKVEKKPLPEDFDVRRMRSAPVQSRVGHPAIFCSHFFISTPLPLGIEVSSWHEGSVPKSVLPSLVFLAAFYRDWERWWVGDAKNASSQRKLQSGERFLVCIFFPFSVFHLIAYLRLGKKHVSSG